MQPSYDRKRTRRAFLLAPLAALAGVLPYLFMLELTVGQSLLATLAITVCAYLFGLVIGVPGYLILRLLNRHTATYLMGYAVFVVGAIAVLYRDPYVLASLGPPILLAAGAFCWLRGRPISEHKKAASQADQDSSSESMATTS